MIYYFTFLKVFILKKERFYLISDMPNSPDLHKYIVLEKRH